MCPAAHADRRSTFASGGMLQSALWHTYRHPISPVLHSACCSWDCVAAMGRGRGGVGGLNVQGSGTRRQWLCCPEARRPGHGARPLSAAWAGEHRQCACPEASTDSTTRAPAVVCQAGGCRARALFCRAGLSLGCAHAAEECTAFVKCACRACQTCMHSCIGAGFSQTLLAGYAVSSALRARAYTHVQRCLAELQHLQQTM